MKCTFCVNKPFLAIDWQKLNQSGISEKELRRYFPRYILDPAPLEYSWLKRILVVVVQWIIRAMIWIFLKPRHTKTGSLDQCEVDDVYTREAENYDLKHHFTTHGMDLVWRRSAGWFLANISRNKRSSLRVLDICTGTGLTIKEMLAILADWSSADVFITGLDYNSAMIEVAHKNVCAPCVNFVQGDATKLGTVISEKSIDVVTQVFGIGGIPDPLKVFEGVLQVLRNGGQFFLIDMHRPMPELPGELFFFYKWLRMPILEAVTYEETTIPLALNRLWGWRDATLLFYLLPLITYRDSDSRFWSFEIKFFEQESQRWWLSLPIMPTARIIAEKTEVSPEETERRRIILEACSTC